MIIKLRAVSHNLTKPHPAQHTTALFPTSKLIILSRGRATLFDIRIPPTLSFKPQKHKRKNALKTQHVISG